MKDILWILVIFWLGYSDAFEQDPRCLTGVNTSAPILVGDENDCRQYYLCLEGHSYPFNCPDGQHWSVERNRCELAADANCQIKTMRMAIENGVIYTGCPLDEDPNNPTHFPHPDSCTQFLKCSYGRVYVIKCPFGLHWDIKGNRCESPFVAKCSITDSSTQSNTIPTIPTIPTQRWTTPSTTKASTAPPRTSTSTTVQTKTTARSTPSTPTTQDPHLPVPLPECSETSSTKRFGILGECKMFMQCHLGNAYRIPCRAGREWSTAVNDCIDATLAGCSNTLTTTAATSTTISIATTKTAATCTLKDEYLSHPTDCSKFIQCDNGRAIEKDCSPGLFWSKKTKNCQWTSADCR